jgi:hypothetical protein
MPGVHEFTVIGASGTSGNGFWIFFAALVAGAVLTLVWVVARLRANGYFERSRPTIEVFPELYDKDVPHAA